MGTARWTHGREDGEGGRNIRPRHIQVELGDLQVDSGAGAVAGSAADAPHGYVRGALGEEWRDEATRIPLVVTWPLRVRESERFRGWGGEVVLGTVEVKWLLRSSSVEGRIMETLRRHFVACCIRSRPRDALGCAGAGATQPAIVVSVPGSWRAAPTWFLRGHTVLSIGLWRLGTNIATSARRP